MAKEFVVEELAVAPFVGFENDPGEGDGEDGVDEVLFAPMDGPEAEADEAFVTAEVQDEGGGDDGEGEGDGENEEVLVREGGVDVEGR